MSADGLTFSTTGEFERRLWIFADNRWQYYSGEARRDDDAGTLLLYILKFAQCLYVLSHTSTNTSTFT